MLFSERKELADKADQWMEEKHVGKTSLGVISYLDVMGLLKLDNENGDLISRQDAIDAVADGLKRVFSENRDVAEILLKNAPSAQPERKKGEWTTLGFKDEAWGEAFECSICGEMAIGKANYCYNCGADMRG